jgi:hypothetical protein
LSYLCAPGICQINSRSFAFKFRFPSRHGSLSSSIAGRFQPRDGQCPWPW